MNIVINNKLDDDCIKLHEDSSIIKFQQHRETLYLYKFHPMIK